MSAQDNVVPNHPRFSRKEIEEALWLWPNPEDAPEVPALDVLRRFASDPAQVDPDLRSQILESINCHRILARWQEESPGGLMENGDEPLPGYNLPDRVPHSSSGPSLPPKGNRCFGELWNTRTDVEIFDSEGFQKRRTAQPPLVLLASAPQSMPWADEIVRAVVASPVELWPEEMLADDEMVLTVEGMGRFVAHFWLNYPLSVSQLSVCRGALTPEDLENFEAGLQAFEEGLPISPDLGGGLPLDARQDSDVLRERERLHAFAAYLAYTADAFRAWWEADPSQPAGIGIFPSHPAEASTELALAAQTKAWSPSLARWFRVEDTDLLLQIGMETDMKHCDVLVAKPDGSWSGQLDGAVIVTPRGTSNPFVRGQSRLPAEWLAHGFRLRTKDGGILRLLQCTNEDK